MNDFVYTFAQFIIQLTNLKLKQGSTPFTRIGLCVTNGFQHFHIYTTAMIMEGIIL